MGGGVKKYKQNKILNNHARINIRRSAVCEMRNMKNDSIVE